MYIIIFGSYSSCSANFSDHPNLNACHRLIDIHSLFVEFLSSLVFFDHSVLIDYFISSETLKVFRQLLSKYLPLAVKEWSSVRRICEELDTHNKEILNSSVLEPTYRSESENHKGDQDVSQWSLHSSEEFDRHNEEMPEPIALQSTRLSGNLKSETHKGSEDVSPSSSLYRWTTVKRPKLDLDCSFSVSPVNVSHPTTTKIYTTAEEHQRALVISTAHVSGTTIKQPNVDRESGCSNEKNVSDPRSCLAERDQKEMLTTCTTRASEEVPSSGRDIDASHPVTQEVQKQDDVSHQKTYLSRKEILAVRTTRTILEAPNYCMDIDTSHAATQEVQKQMLVATGADWSEVSSRESAESEWEWEGSGSEYSESTLDKVMDCLTQFKYSLQRLQSHQLLAVAMDEPNLTPTSRYSCSVESIISLLELLEELYEAMAN